MEAVPELEVGVRPGTEVLTPCWLVYIRRFGGRVLMKEKDPPPHVNE